MSRSVGWLMTFVLHISLLGLLFQHAAPTRRSDFGNPTGKEKAPNNSMVLITIAPLPEEGSARTFSVPTELLSSISLNVEAPELIPGDEAVSEQSSGAALTASEVAAQLAMFGRYSAQTTARIDRAWIHPRSEIREREFQCTVRVRQSSEGLVLSTELVDCNGDTRWQESLVFAIEQASPLPAPPDPSVFSEELVLTFTAQVATGAHENSQQSAF